MCSLDGRMLEMWKITVSMKLAVQTKSNLLYRPRITVFGKNKIIQRTKIDTSV